MRLSSRHGIVFVSAPGIVLALLCLLPFLSKAYTIDDPWFLLEARQILRTPFQPMSFAICWMDSETCVARADRWDPGIAQGLMGYLLVPVVLAGGAEWIAHLLQLLLVCLTVLAIVKLVLRLGFNQFQAAAAGMLLVAIPPLLSMASTAMPDVAALALGLTGLERLLAWKHGRRWHQALAACLALGLAPYARPHVALFLPLGALWLLDSFEVRKAARQISQDVFLWFPVIVAAIILLTINLVTRDHNLPAAPEKILLGSGNSWANLRAYLIYLCIPIPFTLVWLAAHWRRAKFLVVFPAIPILIAHYTVFPSRGLIREWQMAAVLYTVAALADMISRYVKAQDRIGVLLSLWILTPLPIIFYVHFPIKYMVAVLPAIVLILLRALSGLPKLRVSLVYSFLITVSAGFSVLLLRADADFAEYGRRAAAELIAPHVAAGERVWYGGEWGFYWYAQEAGAKISKPGEPGPNPGELLSVGLMESGGLTRDRFPNRELIDSRSYSSPHGRTMGYGAGLYSNGYGFLLWRWDPDAKNVYELWRVH